MENYLDDGTRSRYRRGVFQKGRLFDHIKGALSDVPIRELQRSSHRMLDWLSKEISTQELSETDNMRGAKLEVGILGVVVPLMDGVFSP